MVAEFLVSLIVELSIHGCVENDNGLAGLDHISRHKLIKGKPDFLDPFLGGGVVIGRAYEVEFLLLFVQQDDKGALGIQESFDLLADVILERLQFRIFGEGPADP
jgi:hypothetical protein